MTGRILVLRGGALGDFVLGLPALAALREAYPRAALHLMAPGGVLPLASSLASESTPLERAETAWLFSEGEEIPGEVAGRLRDLDLAVLWMADGSGAVRANLGRLGARRVLHAPALPQTPGVHAADHLLETLRPLGVPLRFPALPAVSPEAPDMREAAALLERLGVARGRPAVAIHPGSGGDWKRWPAERFARVAQALIEREIQIVLIQGPADEGAIGDTLARLPGEAPPVASGLGVRRLSALLSLFSCYLGNDSGVTHLAAATGVPVVALFGPTDPAVWGPRGPRVAVLRAAEGEKLDGLEVEPVLESVMRMLRQPAS